MEITYEQAIRLKDAGFPQPGDREEHSIDPRFQNGVYIPTTEELIQSVNTLPVVSLDRWVFDKDFDLDKVVELYIAQKHNKN